jgi:nitroreductase
MELIETIKKRQSIRSFTDKKIPLELIIDMIKYAHMAPSAGNQQARDFIIVDKKEVKEKLCANSLNQRFIIESPFVIIVCANLERIAPYKNRGRDLYCIQDASAAVEHLLLLAVDNGLAACWIGAFDEKKVSEILQLPDYIRPVTIIPIGYPKQIPNPTTRMDIKSLIHFNKW